MKRVAIRPLLLMAVLVALVGMGCYPPFNVLFSDSTIGLRFDYPRRWELTRTSANTLEIKFDRSESQPSLYIWGNANNSSTLEELAATMSETYFIIEPIDTINFHGYSGYDGSILIGAEATIDSAGQIRFLQPSDSTVGYQFTMITIVDGSNSVQIIGRPEAVEKFDKEIKQFSFIQRSNQ